MLSLSGHTIVPGLIYYARFFQEKQLILDKRRTSIIQYIVFESQKHTYILCFS